YPYPARFVYGFTHRRQREINKLRQQIEDETPLTIEESRKLRAQYPEIDRRKQETIDRLNKEIEQLRNASPEPPRPEEEEEPDVSKETSRGDAPALKESELTLLRILARHG